MKTIMDSNEPVAPATETVDDVAYRDGRVDERVRTNRVTDHVAKDAYVQGRRDERARRRGSPLLTFLLLIVVAIGAALIYFAIQNGSFSSGGAVIDQKLSNAAETVKAPIRGAADSAGTALQNAGSNIKKDAGSGNP